MSQVYSELSDANGKILDYARSNLGHSIEFPADCDDFSIIQLPDQHSRQSAIGHQTFEWLMNNWGDLRARVLVMPGDFITDPNNQREWDWIMWEMGRLRANGITIIGCPGNHDWYYGDKTAWNRNASLAFWKWKQPEFVETMTPDDSMNMVFHVDVGGLRLMFLTLACDVAGPWPEQYAWGLQMLQKYSDRLAIVVTHAYLDNDDTLQDPATANYYWGDLIWENAIRKAPNVIQVMCGHTHTSELGWWRLDMNADDGHPVHALNFDTQEWANGGIDYLRVYNWKPRQNLINAQTWHLDTALDAHLTTRTPVRAGNEAHFSFSIVG